MPSEEQYRERNQPKRQALEEESIEIAAITSFEDFLNKAENPHRHDDNDWSKTFRKIPAPSSPARSQLDDEWITAKKQGKSIKEIWPTTPSVFQTYFKDSIESARLLQHT